MPQLSGSESREQFVELLNETVFHALALKEALEEERKALESQEIERIEIAVESKTRCVQKLQELDNTRLQLCAGCGFQEGPEQMEQLIAWCDENDHIKNRWEQLMLIAAESVSLNMTNGAIIRLRQHQFDTSLAVLRGVKPGADTYGRSGTESGSLGTQSLAQA